MNTVPDQRRTRAFARCSIRKRVTLRAASAVTRCLRQVGIVSLLTFCFPLTLLAESMDGTLRLSVDVDAEQDWTRQDEGSTIAQHSKTTSTQRYELLISLRSDGEKRVRNLLDPDMGARMEAKIIHMAREAVRHLGAGGDAFQLPRSPEERAALNRRMQSDRLNCKADPDCLHRVHQQYAAIFAAMEFPEALEDEGIPGQFLYFLPYQGCDYRARVTMQMAIDGVRASRNDRREIAFSERRSGQLTRDTGDGGVALCTHYTIVIDTDDPERPLRVENIYIPSPKGETVRTELEEGWRSDHVARRTESQPLPSAVFRWLTDTLKHAPAKGRAEGDVPLTLPLNGDSTILGTAKGTARVSVEWEFSAPGLDGKD